MFVLQSDDVPEISLHSVCRKRVGEKFSLLRDIIAFRGKPV